jgi:ATP-dependent DNA ligase
VHELELDFHRMHARIDSGRVRLLTARSGLDWTSKYQATAQAE